MHSIFTRLAVVGVAAVLAASAIAPASAATRHKRTHAPSEAITAPVAVPPSQATVPPIFMQNECVSDEGYGRYSVCDQGAS